MRNKFFKGAHLSEKEVKKILAYFSEELTATEIATITGVSRVTINNYLKLIREQICRINDPAFAKKKEPVVMAGMEEEVEDMEEERVPCFFSVSYSDQRVKVLPLDPEGCEAMKKLKKGDLLNGSLEYFSKHLAGYQAFIDPDGWKLLRVDQNLFMLKKTRGYVDELDTFWALARTRFSKFRGLNRTSLYLHLKESEFRYNHRHQNLYEVLCQLLRMNPLGN